MSTRAPLQPKPMSEPAGLPSRSQLLERHHSSGPGAEQATPLPLLPAWRRATATRQRRPAARSEGTDFSAIPARPAPWYELGSSPDQRRSGEQPTVTNRKGSIESRAQSPASAVGRRETRGINSSGAGTVTTSYTPEADDKSSKIVFIQVMRESLDGNPIKPSTATPDTGYLDPDTTGDFFHVDYVPGERDPYYSGDDAQDPGTQGNAIASPKVTATTSDAPNYPDHLFPPGTSKLLWEFRTAAFSAAGADAGKYYAYSDWTYEKEKGIAAKTATAGTGAGNPGTAFEEAVTLWNSNHGFQMPGGGLGAGAIAGIVLGSLVGATALGLGIAAVAGAFN